jgi:NAD(P)-dependent dehydrogenase (short-subunit alcohol dehydrogenase family)
MAHSNEDMEGKTVLVTGGTAGIGLVTARRLAGKGAHVIVVGRSRERGERAVADIGRATGARRADFLAADLADQAKVRDLAEAVSGRFARLDVLINNAGGMFGQRRESPQGLEMTFALNHLSYVVLTCLLLPALRAAAPARIVNVASAAHRGVRLDFDDLQMRHGYSAWKAYKRSKLANLLFTHALARRLDWQNVTVNALHPGFVATDIGVRHRFVPAFVWQLAKLGAISPDRGADTPVYLASAPQVAGVHGRYFIKCSPADTSAAARDRDAAERLWRESIALTSLTPEQVPEPIARERSV